jgi:hypothetical protein
MTLRLNAIEIDAHVISPPPFFSGSRPDGYFLLSRVKVRPGVEPFLRSSKVEVSESSLYLWLRQRLEKVSHRLKEWVLAIESKIEHESKSCGWTLSPKWREAELNYGFGPEPKKSISGTVLKAANYIRENAPCKGDAVAHEIGISSEWFRKGIVPILYRMGFYNDGGYRPPKPRNVAR